MRTEKMPERAIEEYRVAEEPYYLPVDNEVGLFEAAHAAHLPVILKGPTGCGKTALSSTWPGGWNGRLITVACHEDLSSTDLVDAF
jgi:nitric oxide reductase NorQ protein